MIDGLLIFLFFTRGAVLQHILLLLTQEHHLNKPFVSKSAREWAASIRTSCTKPSRGPMVSRHIRLKKAGTHSLIVKDNFELFMTTPSTQMSL